jgi:alpha-tubulin suppressor-like RCC1 family protein
MAAWGDNSSGQRNVPAPNSGFLAVAAGTHFSMALRENGVVAAWGDNSAGQRNVPAPNTGFTAVTGGYLHCLGIKADSSVVAWGDNSSGQCDVPEPNTGFIAVAAGLGHSLGLKATGEVVAWGSNDHGECNLPEPNTGFTSIAARYFQSMALRTTGDTWVSGPATRPQVKHLSIESLAPNPFNPETRLSYRTAVGGSLTLVVHDLLGRELRRASLGEQGVGLHTAVWDGRDNGGRDAASGLYLLRVEGPAGSSATVKGLLVR